MTEPTCPEHAVPLDRCWCFHHYDCGLGGVCVCTAGDRRRALERQEGRR